MLFVATGCSTGSELSLPTDPTPTIPESTTTTQTVPAVPETWESVYLRIWDDFRASQDQGDYPLDVALSPTVDVEKAEESIAAYKEAMKLWLATLDGSPAARVAWSIMSEADHAWWLERVTANEGRERARQWNESTNMFGHCQLTSKSFCGYTSVFPAALEDFAVYLYSVIGSEYSSRPNPETVNHEATHFYQLGLVSRFPDDTPCWFVEGQATLYGVALYVDPAISHHASMMRRESYGDIVREFQPNAAEHSKADWVDVLHRMYQSDVSCGDTQQYFKYAVGLFVWEYLYEAFGPAIMHTIFLQLRDGANFETATDTVLGVSMSDL